MATRIAKKEYDDQSIKSLKGADRVRKRPAVIFGSDDLIGCQHSFIEILANSVDEAREGYGDKIIVKKYSDLSIEVEDFGRGVPLGYNEKEKRFNWELVFCELYAGGKYDNNDGNSAYGTGHADHPGAAGRKARNRRQARLYPPRRTGRDSATVTGEKTETGLYADYAVYAECTGSS